MNECAITFVTESDAFQGSNGPHEIARILRALADKITLDGNAEQAGNIRDVNGNHIGSYDLQLPEGEA